MQLIFWDSVVFQWAQGKPTNQPKTTHHKQNFYLKSTGSSLDVFSVCFYRFMDFLNFFFLVFCEIWEDTFTFSCAKVVSIASVTDLVWRCSLHHLEYIKYWKLGNNFWKKEIFFALGFIDSFRNRDVLIISIYSVRIEQGNWIPELCPGSTASEKHIAIHLYFLHNQISFFN